MAATVIKKANHSCADLAEISHSNCLLPTSYGRVSSPLSASGARDDFHLRSGREDLATGVGPIVSAVAPIPSGIDECGRLASRSLRTAAAGALGPRSCPRPMAGRRNDDVVAVAEFEWPRLGRSVAASVLADSASLAD
jgi:hypothetical protein